jgi:ketosteroid isomerase-like protein
MHALIALMLTAAGPDGGLLTLADAFDRAQLGQDRAAMERMIADNLVYIDGSGKRQGKKEFIEAWMTPDARYDPPVLVDRVIVPLGPDAAIVNAETTLRGMNGGAPFTSRIRYADSFRRVDGKWQVSHIQVTRIAPNQP